MLPWSRSILDFLSPLFVLVLQTLAVSVLSKLDVSSLGCMSARLLLSLQAFLTYLPAETPTSVSSQFRGERKKKTRTWHLKSNVAVFVYAFFALNASANFLAATNTASPSPSVSLGTTVWWNSSGASRIGAIVAAS